MKIELEKLFSGTLTKEQLVNHLMNIVDSLTELEKSSKDFENILLDKKHIFLDHFSNRLVFMYVPIKDNVFEKVSMSEFFKELLAATSYDENDDLPFFVKLHNYLAGATELRLQEFREKLTEFSGVQVQKIEAVSESNSNYYSPGFITRALAISKDSEEENEGTTVLGALQELNKYEEGTTALGVDNGMLLKPFLIEEATGQKIIVTKEVFTLGRDPEQADYASNSKVVGRIHAEVVTSDGEYFLIDKHSRNGSYLNGVKLYPNEKNKIKHEDRIKLANQEFVFRLF
ncbi:FHA domain-containing protein [Neobacillus niacini]|uniref:FHA domain-containing protein n=1 Tax=Neobacillus niacini TaxID=86668 RepID=UPI002FFE13BD